MPGAKLLVGQGAKLPGALDGILDMLALSREMPGVERLCFGLGVAAGAGIPGAAHDLDAQRPAVGVAPWNSKSSFTAAM